jgi:GTP cyclohydrolase I
MTEFTTEDFLGWLGLPESELDDPRLDLRRSPARIMRMLRTELLSSYDPHAFDEMVESFTCFEAHGDEAMVTFAPVAFHSLCSHHFLPFSGTAHIGYVPGAKIVGASKIPRVVNYYSRMFQIQERLVRQVADFLYERASARMVIVLMEAKHSCMGCRGVMSDATMITTAVRPPPGGEQDELLRPVLNEFYAQTAPFRGR